MTPATTTPSTAASCFHRKMEISNDHAHIDGRSASRHDAEQPCLTVDGLTNISLRIRDKPAQQTKRDTVEPLAKYAEYSLLRSMIAAESTRTNKLVADGYKQMTYPKSNDGWLRTLFVIESRGLKNICLPWCVCVLNAIVWTIFAEVVGDDDNKGSDVESWSFFVGLILNASLAFLLVFRLNRAAERFWLARTSWGYIVSCERYFVDGILVHGSHQPENRDDVVRWALAFAVASKQYIRSEPIDSEALAGILEPHDVERMASAQHPPLYASSSIRSLLKKMFLVTSETPAGLAVGWSHQLKLLESTLNFMMTQQATMERIKGTPLPLVYVTHLRTFLLIFLLVLPYVWQSEFGWTTIPVMALTSFALLGLEGAAEEVESPFRKSCPNHLNMDGYCLLIFRTTQQLLADSADRDIEAIGRNTLKETEA